MIVLDVHPIAKRAFTILVRMSARQEHPRAKRNDLSIVLLRRRGCELNIQLPRLVWGFIGRQRALRNFFEPFALLARACPPPKTRLHLACHRRVSRSTAA